MKRNLLMHRVKKEIPPLFAAGRCCLLLVVLFGAIAAAGEPSGAGGPEAAPKPTPEEAAAKAPKTALDEGFLFGPELATALQGKPRAGVTAHSVTFIGPGLPQKDLDGFKPVGPWTLIPGKELSGPQNGAPGQLVYSLPGFLAKNKPELVVIVGDMNTTRKQGANERYDWEDVTRICFRMGAIPIVVPPASGANDEVRTLLTESMNNSGALGLDFKAPTQAVKKLADLLDLLDRHVFLRVALDAPKASTKKVDVEE